MTSITRASLRNFDRSVFFTLIYTEKNSRSGGICCFLFRHENNIRLHRPRHPIPHCRQILSALYPHPVHRLRCTFSNTPDSPVRSYTSRTYTSCNTPARISQAAFRSVYYIPYTLLWYLSGSGSPVSCHVHRFLKLSLYSIALCILLTTFSSYRTLFLFCFCYTGDISHSIQYHCRKISIRFECVLR